MAKKKVESDRSITKEKEEDKQGMHPTTLHMFSLLMKFNAALHRNQMEYGSWGL
jgi:hypothetical protein